MDNALRLLCVYKYIDTCVWYTRLNAQSLHKVLVHRNIVIIYNISCRCFFFFFEYPMRPVVVKRKR